MSKPQSKAASVRPCLTVEQSHDDRMLRMCHDAMQVKMDEGRAAGKCLWHDKDRCSPSALHHYLLCALADGDLISVMNYAGMLHIRGDMGPVGFPHPKEVEQLKKELADTKDKVVTQLDTIRLQKMTIDQQNEQLARKVNSADGAHVAELYGDVLNHARAVGGAVGGAIKGVALEANLAEVERDRAYVTVTKSVGDIQQTATIEFDFVSTDSSTAEIAAAVERTIHALDGPEQMTVTNELHLDPMEHPGCC